MTKFFNVKDARVGFERRDDFVLELYHPAYGIFRVTGFDDCKIPIVYFQRYGKPHWVWADECTYNYSTEDVKQKSPASNPFTQDRQDKHYKNIQTALMVLSKCPMELFENPDIKIYYQPDYDPSAMTLLNQKEILKEKP